MIRFWILVALTGLLGALADVVINQWSRTLFSYWYFMSAGLYVVFMTGFGLSMRFGEAHGYSLTIVVLVVLLANIAGVALWDLVVGGSRFTPLQWLGVSLAVAAMLCFELGRR